MRISRFLNIAVLATLVGMSGALYAQDEKPQEAKPPKQEEARPEAKQDEMKAPKQEKPDQAKPEQQEKQDQMKPAQQGDMKPQQPEEPKPSKEEQKAQKAQQKQQEKEQKDQMKHGQKEPAAQSGNEAHPAAQANNGGGAVGHPKGKSARIPEDKFRSSFGHSHTFVVHRTTVVQGQPGFVYEGVNFIFLDPWPGDWAYTDDCYVDYVDGEYFLFDLLHPGIRIALFVVL